MRVMIFMFTTTYGESVISTPIWAMSEPSGPMLKGMTYIVRPFMQPSNRPSSMPFISSGSIQLFVGPASSLLLRADVRAVFDAGDVARVGSGEEAVRPLLGVQLDERAGVDHLLAQAVVLLVRAVAPVDVVGLAELGHLGDPLPEPVVLHVVGCVHVQSFA